jgi:hypothetical protein
VHGTPGCSERVLPPFKEHSISTYLLGVRWLATAFSCASRKRWGRVEDPPLATFNDQITLQR